MDAMDSDDESTPTRPRTPLHMRLGSLLPSTSSQHPAINGTRRDQTKVAPAAPTTAPSRSTSIPRLVFGSDVDGREPQPTSPIISWFSSLTSTPERSHTQSRDQSPSRNSHMSPPFPSLASLNEALTTTLPQLPKKPPQARIPPHFRARRPPPLLDNLARSTLPTASLSGPLRFDGTLHTRSTSLHSNLSSPSVSYHAPTPGRSSVDTLRSVHRRSIHYTSPTAARKSWWDNKDGIDSLLQETDRAETVSQEQAHIRKKYLATKEPIVFCHGLLGFDSVTIGPAIAPLQVTHWRGIKEVLEANGVEVLITRVPGTSGPRERAMVLLEKIEKAYAGRSVHLIGHSMGGLDCRYLTTHLTERTFKVLSLTTVATPHRGSAFASHFLEAIGGPERLSPVLSLLELLPIGGGDGKAFECLTVENMRKFNEDTPDVPGVRYFSWGAVYDPGLIDTWKYPHSIVLEKEGPNDGLVSVHSAKWGTYLGTLEHVNHLDLVGWVNTARYKWAEMWGNEINFRPATFYLGIADILATEVEGIKRDEEGGRDLAASPTRQGETGVDEQLQPTRESHDEHSLLDKGETVARETVGDAPDRDDTSKK